MYWENPGVLLLLWILPLVAGLLAYAHRKRVATAARFADPAMVARLMPPLRSPRPWVKGAAILVGLGLLIVAGARPRFGVYFEKVVQRGADVFILLDVSRSMTAEDVAPNRLERAKSDIRDLLGRLIGDRVGLIVFAGKPVVKVPLTTDHGFFQMVLDEIGVASAPRGGSLIGDAIRRAMEAVPEQRDRDQALVLITDGEDHDSYPEQAAQQAAERGIKIFTVGLGDSREGSRVPLRDSSGELRYLRYQGQEVWSKEDERLLKQIALVTHGAYIPAGTKAYDLGQIYQEHLSGLAKGQIQEDKRKRYREQFQLFVCLGVAMLLIEMAIPSYRGQRIEGGQSLKQSRGPRITAQGHRRTVAPSLGKEAIVSLLTMMLAVAAAAPARAGGQREAAAKVRQGIERFAAGDFKGAGAAFAEADVAKPEDAWIAFDRAAAYAAQGDAEKAAELLRKAALSRDASLAARSHYNLGCLAAGKARALFGEQPQNAAPEVRQQGRGLLAEAIGHYRDCLRLDAAHPDARYNLEAIRLWSKHMEAAWEERDRQKQRQEMGLLEFLEMLQSRQRPLRATTRSLAAEPDSPRRRQAVATGAAAQRTLTDEIGPLKEKIQEGVGKGTRPPTPGAKPSPPTLNPDQQKAVEALSQLADEAGQAMRTAADRLGDGTPADAVPSQTQAVEALDRMLTALIPFANLLQKAIAQQQALVEQVSLVARPASPTTGKPGPSNRVDLAEAAWEQGFLPAWSDALGAKADQGLTEPEPAAGAAPGPAPGQASPKTSPDNEATKKHQEAVKRAFQKAVASCPKVRSLTSDAAAALKEHKAAAAMENQEAALKLLREIADQLPKQDQQDQQQNKEDPQQQDQDSQPQQQKSQEQRQSQPKDASREQAEAILRKARQRERERQELEKQLQQGMYRPEPVDKDW